METCYRQQATQAIKGILSRGSLLALSCMLSFTVVAEPKGAALIPFHAEYTAYKWGDDVGKAQMTLSEEPAGTFTLNYISDVSKFFLSDKRQERSVFRVDHEKLIPQKYEYSRSGTGKNNSLTIEFRTQDKTLLINESDSMPWNGETDNQLYRLDLSRQLATGKQEMAYDFINYRGEKRTYVIRVEGEEQLTVPFGQLNTVKVKIVRENNERETYAWFAPSLGYHLVRLQQFKDGDEQGDIRLKSYRQLSAE